MENKNIGSKAADLAHACSGMKVLYVEDNEEARVQTVKLLENFFKDITTARDGRDGMIKYAAHDFDIIISDINMPVMNGIELLKKIREVDANIPVLLFTAHSDKNFFLESINHNVDGYLVKPVTLEPLIHQLKKTVDAVVIKRQHDEYKLKLESINEELEHKVRVRTEQIKKHMHTDSLTSIPSRHALLSKLKDLAEDYSPVIILFDIQSFKLFNELYGMDVGNEILKKFTQMIENFIRTSTYHLYRISGDEFVLYEEVRQMSRETHIDYAKKLCSFVESNGLYIEKIDEKVTLSIRAGISFSRENPLGKADMALNHSKETNSNITCYDDLQGTKEKTKNILYWKEEISSALDEDRLEPYFQPILDRNRKIIKYEVLTRLMQNSPDGVKAVSPAAFLSIAAKTGRYRMISYRVIKKAIMQMKDTEHCLSININYQDLTNPLVVNLLHESICDYYNRPGKFITLEILENDQITDYEQFTSMLKIFRDEGAKIAVDDFGSGYSNFTHIAGLHPDYLKIDGSLIKNIHTSDKSFRMVNGIIKFAQEMGIRTVAEFVSDENIFNTAMNIGVDEFQGFYFSKPVPLSEIE